MKKAIGIDLGTTNSVVAFKDTAVRILRNKEGDELTRSCVGLRKGDFLVGRNAYLDIGRDPINTILSIKRLMGGAIKDKMVKDMIANPYYKFGITSLKGGTEDAVAVILGGKEYTPEQISAEILKKLKSDAEERLGDEVTHAVITVPAYFTEKQKNATRVAAQLAGLKVQRLLSEPTAAAIAYGIDNLKVGDAKTIMIYDFGGGTFDLSILNIVDGQYMEAGTGGDRWLGGDDLDRKLEQLVLANVSKQYQIADINKSIQNLSDKKRWLFEGQLRLKTEEAKVQLSSEKSAPIYIDNLLEDENGDIIDIDITISRDEFELLAKPFIERTIELIRNLIKKVGYEINMVNNILLVGGTSCIPLIKQMLADIFPTTQIKVSEKPMLAVAEGAAILAHRLGGEYEAPANDVASIKEISHTTNHNYYIQLKDGYEKIIEDQIPKPISISRTFKTTVSNQKVVKVSLWSDIEDGKLVEETKGFFTLEQDLPIGSEIVFNISLDLDEIFEVKVYPKNNKTKIKQIVLGRGNKDSRALKFISDCLEKILSKDYSERQREYFLNTARKEIENINALGIDNSDSEKWEEIGTNTFAALEQAERITDDVDEDSFAIIVATILIGEYPDLIDSDDSTKMKQLLSDAKHNDDPMIKLQAAQKLRLITDDYPLLLHLFTVKMASTKAAKTNPTDAHRLLQMHDQIVNLFRNRKKDEALTLLNEATELRDKYQEGGVDINSIHLAAS